MKGRDIVTTGVAIILIVIVLSVSDLSELPNYLKNNGRYFWIFLTLFSISYLLRVFRYYFLLSENNFIDVDLAGFLPQGLIAGTIATYGPLKTGELIAVEIYHQYFNAERGKSLSVIIVSRVLDVIMVLLLVASAIFLIPTDVIGGIYQYIGFLVVVLIIAFIILLSERIGMRFLDLVKPLFVSKLSIIHEKLVEIADQYYSGLRKLNSRRSMLLLFLFTISRWIVEVLFYFSIFYSFSFGLSVLQVLPIVGFSYAIGVSSGTPGALGTFQLTALSILVFYGVASGIAGLSLVIGTATTIVINVGMAVLGIISSRFKDVSEIGVVTSPDNLSD